MELPKYITAHCQAATVKWNDREYSIQSDRNGFRYIKVSHNGKRKVIPVKDEVPDMIFDYIFNGKFKTNPNSILDMCALLRSRNDKEKTFNDNKLRYGIYGSFSDFKKKASQLNRKFKAEYEPRTPNPGN